MAKGGGLTRGKVSLWVSPPSPPLPTYGFSSPFGSLCKLHVIINRNKVVLGGLSATHVELHFAPASVSSFDVRTRMCIYAQPNGI